MLLPPTIFTSEQPINQQSPYCCSERLLDDLEWACSRVLRIPKTSPSSDLPEQPTNELLQSYFIDGHIKKRIDKNKHLFLRSSSQPLHYALHREVENNWAGLEAWPHERQALLRCLLSHGHDPNTPVHRTAGDDDSPVETSWTQFICRVVPSLEFQRRGKTGDSVVGEFNVNSKCLDELAECLENGVFRALLDHGADPNARVGERGGPLLPVWARFLFLGLQMLPGLGAQASAYIDALDIMLCRADFSRHEDGLNSLVEEIFRKNRIRSSFSTPAFGSLRKQQARKRMMELIYLQLDQKISLGSDRLYEAYRTDDCVRLRIHSIYLFMARAAHPTVPMEVLKSRIPPEFQQRWRAPRVLNPVVYYRDTPCPIRSAVPRSISRVHDCYASDFSDSDASTTSSTDSRTPKRMRTGY